MYALVGKTTIGKNSEGAFDKTKCMNEEESECLTCLYKIFWFFILKTRCIERFICGISVWRGVQP